MYESHIYTGIQGILWRLKRNRTQSFNFRHSKFTDHLWNITLFLIEVIYQERPWGGAWGKTHHWVHLSALSLRTKSRLSKRRGGLALIFSFPESAHSHHGRAQWKVAEYVRKKINHKDSSCWNPARYGMGLHGWVEHVILGRSTLPYQPPLTPIVGCSTSACTRLTD